jgi:hypothetical protein
VGCFDFVHGVKQVHDAVPYRLLLMNFNMPSTAEMALELIS